MFRTCMLTNDARVHDFYIIIGRFEKKYIKKDKQGCFEFVCRTCRWRYFVSHCIANDLLSGVVGYEIAGDAQC